jgi:hypothetical protein
MFGLSTVITKLNQIKAAIESAASMVITPATLSVANDTVTAGYYEATTLHAVDADLATANIKAGVTIFGIAGKAEVVDTTEAGDPVIASRMKTGDIAFVNGSKITGNGTVSMANNTKIIPAGYHALSALDTIDADFDALNIAAGKTMFGVAGVFSDDATAVAADIALGKTAYVGGVKITGTHE